MCSEARAPFADAGVVIGRAADEFAIGAFDKVGRAEEHDSFVSGVKGKPVG